MTREFFLYLSTAGWLRNWMETSTLSRKLTRRFIAGETLEDELEVCERLRAQRISSILCHLGENVATPEEAAAARDTCILALDKLAQARLPATIAIKLTHFGLDIDESLCVENLRALAAKARDTGTRVEVDMEATQYTATTLRIVARASAEFGCLRAVIQAYLYRSAADIEFCNRMKIPVRLCKGAYSEPASLAMPLKSDVDRSYMELMKALLEGGVDPAFATHDEAMIRVARNYPEKDRFEFQMLYGIRRDLQKRLIDEGYRLRLYVPYGTAWYPYFMRRLAERPANALFLLRNLFR